MTIQQKIKKIMQDTGCSPNEACEMLGVDIDAATMASLAMEDRPVSLAEIIEGGKTLAAKVLVDIIEDHTAENKDRIAAAKIILIGSGELPNIGVNAYEERFKKFTQLLNANSVNNIIDVEDTTIVSKNRLLEMAS